MKLDTDTSFTLNSRTLLSKPNSPLIENSTSGANASANNLTLSSASDKTSQLNNQTGTTADRVTLGSYQSSSVYSVKTVSSSSADQPSSASQAISQAITNQLADDAIQGASTQALQSRLEAGLEGFLDGYAQAVDILGGLENLPDEVRKQTQATYNDVLNTISALAEQYGLDDPAQALKPVGTEADNVDVESVLGAVLDNNLQAGGFQQKTFDFALHTADGDTINIKVNAQSAASYAQSGSISAFAALSESSYELDIVGELDSDEQKAIGDLLNQIGDVSRSFYDGDIGKAFNDVQSLGFDSNEIAGFALTLTYSEYTQQSATPLSEGGISKPDVLNNAVTQLADFIKQLDIIKKSAESFAINNRSLTDIFTSLNQNQPNIQQAGESINAMLSGIDNAKSSYTLR